MTTLRGSDGTVHFSELKQFARSAANYRAIIERPRKPTSAMRIGTIVHHIVLGPTLRQTVKRFTGAVRRGKEWDKFAADNADCEIVTNAEWGEAEPIAAAVLANKDARRLLEGARFEVPLSWTDGGVECGTRGVDIVGHNYLADLKTVTSARPDELQREALRMHYHAQLAYYDTGARANRMDVSGGLYLICVERKDPYNVTVLEMTEGVLEHGKKSVGLWLEELKKCEAADHWPGYVQAPVPWQLPPWLDEDEDAEELDDEEAA